MWINKIKMKKFQMLIIGIIVLISSFMLSSSLGIITSVDKPMDKLIEETKTPIVFMPIDKYKGVSDDILKAKKDFKKDRKVSKVDVIKDAVKAGGKIKYKNKDMGSGANYFLSYSKGEFGYPKFIKGGGNLQDGECFISSILAETYGISIGDYISVENPNKFVKLKVKGVFSDPYSVSMIFGLNRFYVNSNELKDIYGQKKEILTVFSNDYDADEDVVKEYRKNSTKQLPCKILNLNGAKQSAELSEEMTGAFIGAFALIVLLVSAVVIRASIYDSIVKEYKSIGIYKAMGYSERTIMNIYIKAYSSVILIASIIGSLFSKFLISYTLKESFKAYVVDAEINYIMPMILTTIFIIFIILISIYGVIRKVKKVSPVKALTIGIPSNNKKGISLRFMQSSFSVIAQAARKILNYKKYSLILFLILLVCSYSVAFSVTVDNSLNTFSGKSNFLFGFDNAKYRISINDRSKENEVYKWLKNSSEVKNLVEGNLAYDNAEISKDEINGNGTIVLEAYKKYDKDGITEDVIDGRNPKYDNEVALCKKLLKKIHRSLGDYVDIYVAGQRKSLLIVGSYQSTMHSGMNARTLESTVRSADEGYFSTIISFNLKNNNDYKSFKSKVLNKFGKAIAVDESKESYRDNLKSMISGAKSAIMPFIILLILIGGVNVFSIIMLMNVNSKRDFCIYKSIGHSTAALVEANCVYVLTLGIFAVLLCIPVFSLSYPIIMDSMFNMVGMYKYPADIKVSILIIGLVCSMGIYMLSTLLSSISIRNLKVDELKED